jgi:hypothetical protein
LSLQGGTPEFNGIFTSFLFPSLVALRLSCTDPRTTLRDVHQAIAATPRLKEFHLHFYVPFKIHRFLGQQDGSHLTGSLCKFAPGLVTLVIDRITSSVDVLALVHSSWLKDGWPTLSRRQISVEFILDNPLVVDGLKWEVEHSGSLPFHASARYVLGGLWSWKGLNARELHDCWDDILKFRSG